MYLLLLVTTHFLFLFFSPHLFIYWFFEAGYLCVALVPVLELALVDQVSLKLTEIRLPLPPECRD